MKKAILFCKSTSVALFPSAQHTTYDELRDFELNPKKSRQKKDLWIRVLERDKKPKWLNVPLTLTKGLFLNYVG